jgi:hypothetical protein
MLQTPLIRGYKSVSWSIADIYALLTPTAAEPQFAHKECAM